MALRDCLNFDYDHDDHGQPSKHPHDENGGHYHDWDNGVRGPAYAIELAPLSGATLVTACTIGFMMVIADDVTGVGIANDALLFPLSAGIEKGIIMIMG